MLNQKSNDLVEGSNESAKLLVNILQELICVVEKLDVRSQGLGLYGGLAGDLLFLWKANNFQPDLVDESVFEHKFSYLQEHFSIQQFNLSFGLSGIGWLIEYLNQSQTDYDPQLCESIDHVLLEQINIDKWQGELEVVMGLAGIASYAARRARKSEQQDIFEVLLRHYDSNATKLSDNLISWPQPLNSVYRMSEVEDKSNEYNLGLAHGVTGIIAALIPALKLKAQQAKARELLSQSCEWLLHQENSAKNKKCYFKSTNKSKRTSRLGWCYGDLTIALTLARAGIALNVPKYIEKAREIGLHAAKRTASNAMIKDASICHGSMGLAVIFKLLSELLERESDELMRAAKFWLQYTVELYQKEGIEGFHYFSGKTGEFVENTSLLEGYSGIGLGLLTFLDETTDWTDCLLMS